MIFRHTAHPERELRLAYCFNLAPANDVAALIALLERLALPIAERFAQGAPFGVGLYLSAELARALDGAAGEEPLHRLGNYLASKQLDPFTCNAFPFGGFGEKGLKAGVFRPGWHESARLEHTLAVARAMARLARLARGSAQAEPPAEGAHVSISTHTGGLASELADPKALERAVANQARAADALARIEETTGVRVALALEPEPGANAGDWSALEAHLAWARPRAVALLEEEANRESAHAVTLLERHLGGCLDTCHAAVAGEARTLVQALEAGRAQGPFKLQLSNALAVREPDANPAAVEALFALDEPRFLHQVRALGPFSGGLEAPAGLDDLSELRAALDGPDGARWRAAAAWTCHFHVPLDLEHGAGGLGTTRDDAARVLAALAADPARWSTRELHVEIETYTWEALPGWARGEGELLAGMVREYEFAIGLLALLGWHPAGR